MRLNKEREQELQPKRMEYAISEIEALGYVDMILITEIKQKSLSYLRGKRLQCFLTLGGSLEKPLQMEEE